MSGVLGGTIGTFNQKLSFVTSQTGSFTTSQLTISHPVGVVAGDLLVFFHYTWDNDSDYVNSYPTNFSPIYTDQYSYTTSTHLAIAVSYRVLPDLNTFITPVPLGTLTDASHYTSLYFRPSNGISSVVISAPVNQNTTGDPTAQTVSASGVAPAIIVFGNVQIVSGTPAFNVASPAFDGTVLSTAATNTEAITGYKIYNSNPQNHTIDMADLGTNRLTSFYLAVR
jgi:hypothetical protein